MLKSQTEEKELFSWKILFIIVLTAWIVIVDTSPAFVVPRIFFDVSPTATDRRVMLYGRNDTIVHPDLESVPPSIEGWNKSDISYKWIYLKEAYHAESQVLFCTPTAKTRVFTFQSCEPIPRESWCTGLHTAMNCRDTRRSLKASSTSSPTKASRCR